MKEYITSKLYKDIIQQRSYLLNKGLRDNDIITVVHLTFDDYRQFIKNLESYYHFNYDGKTPITLGGYLVFQTSADVSYVISGLASTYPNTNKDIPIEFPFHNFPGSSMDK